jgi:hypothetical protein
VANGIRRQRSGGSYETKEAAMPPSWNLECLHVGSYSFLGQQVNLPYLLNSYHATMGKI